MSVLARLRQLEHKWQHYWSENKTFEANAPAPAAGCTVPSPPAQEAGKGPRVPPKFFTTFPYPYMNGKLHLGHLFTMTKCEFAAGYHRMRGDNSLFPLSFHVTGMPICGAAKKLQCELETFGCPPVFPQRSGDVNAVEEGEASQAAAATSAPAADQASAQGEFHTKRAKATAKTGNAKYQWEIMQALGIPDSEIPQFVDPRKWISTFPQMAMDDLKDFGARVDWRRSFITTDASPYYDSFVRWQFNRLREAGYIKYGKRNCIWSPQEGQPCMDHDRSSGEGVLPQDYVNIRIRLIQRADLEPGAFPWSDELREKFTDFDRKALNERNERVYDMIRKRTAERLSAGVSEKLRSQIDGLASSPFVVFLPASTLRAETMIGQTNCWVKPDGVYGVYAAARADPASPLEVYISSPHAALNMSHQSLLDCEFGHPELLCEVRGEELLNCVVKAPMTVYSHIYVLPLLTISMEKGTGVVTSVPSDAPDDYACYADIKANYKGICDTYGIDAAQELGGRPPLAIVELPGIGTCAAERLCVEKGVKSQHDAELLKEIKEICYRQGFYDGVMRMGPFAGRKVQEAKVLCRDLMIQSGEAFAYSEPASEVVSRSGCKCVVAQANQWYLAYGEADWKALAEKCLEGINTFAPEVRNQFASVLDWFREWAVSRSFGLGTKLPWDTQYVIESLSDSTIYNAYYTVSHYLQGGRLDGVQPDGSELFPVACVDDDFWSFVFCKTDALPSKFVEYTQTHLARILESGLFPGASTALDVLNTFRASFSYFYPVDMRCSGKDLVPNHLTMFIYNHVAIWKDQPQFWPKGIRANGHIMVNGLPMSKSRGNFITAEHALQRFGADATRFCLADAGDGLDNANFDTSVAEAAIMRLGQLLDACRELMTASGLTEGKRPSLGTTPHNVFGAQIDDCLVRSCAAFDACLFREGMLICMNELPRCRDAYTKACGNQGLAYDEALVCRYLEAQARLLAVCCPHVAEELWQEVLGRKESVFQCPLPSTSELEAAASATAKYLRIPDYLSSVTARLKTRLSDVSKPRKDGTLQFPEGIKAARVYVAADCPDWQSRVADRLREIYVSAGGSLPKDAIGTVRKFALEELQMPAKEAQKVVKYASSLSANAKLEGADAFVTHMPFDECAVLTEYAFVLRQSLGVKELEIYGPGDGPEASAAAKTSTPGKPSIFFS